MEKEFLLWPKNAGAAAFTSLTAARLAALLPAEWHPRPEITDRTGITLHLTVPPNWTGEEAADLFQDPLLADWHSIEL